MTKQTTDKEMLPLLPLRDVVVYPNMVIPLFVGRPKSIAALEAANASDKMIMLTAQKSAADEDPALSDIYDVGCVAMVMQMLKLPDGTVKVLAEGRYRARIDMAEADADYLKAAVSKLETDETVTKETEALRRTITGQFDAYLKQNKKIPQEVINAVTSIESMTRFTDTVAAHLPMRVELKQQILSITDLNERMNTLTGLLDGEMDILQVEKKIRTRVKRQMEKSQRDYYLNEQVKAIQRELGETEDGQEFEQYEKRIREAKMSKEAHEKAMSELKKLKSMSPMSAEATVARNYIETLVSLPWQKKSRISRDLKRAEDILEQDHYGLEKVKERILEYLAVGQRVDKSKAPILCFMGPPGVGKTSLGQSIARATNRKYIRMALGGVRDEAEIRGHRRTYIGALPGKILQLLVKAGVRNPLFLLDEVDKLGADYRGDPSAALLEVLDPEQNHTFSDHYVEVDFDLSDVMFIATSNSYNIPPALLDRMEVINLSGYTEDEKTSIAMRYLIPKQTKNNGLKAGEIEITEDAVRDIIRYYTREAGVRALEREISKICRKVVKTIVLKKTKGRVSVTPETLETYLGVRQFTFGVAEKENQVGEVTGLAWTEVGGELLSIEAVHVPGKGQIVRTGTLGDVMKESIEAARTVVRSRAAKLGIKNEVFEKSDMHIHVPEGATPKDGPSAGITMATAIVSSLTGIPVKSDVAMTGEITLRGEVLPIGGLKEKLLAAIRGSISRVIIPQENVKDLAEIPDNIKNRLEIIPVRWIDKVFETALEYQPKPLSEDADVQEPEPAPAVAKKRSVSGKSRSVAH